MSLLDAARAIVRESDLSVRYSLIDRRLLLALIEAIEKVEAP